MKWNLLVVAALAWCDAAGADEWPQWMGPRRDNIWREEGIVEKFPEGGPPVLWRTPIASGYAGPAVADGRVVLMDYVTDDDTKADNFERKEGSGTERVLCLDEVTGEVLWKHEYPVTYTISYPAGPRCTPTIADGKVYALGAEGHLWCRELKSGEPIWSKDFKGEYGTKSAMWGYAGHPLLDGEQLICIVGGEGSHVVAFHKDTGEELWKSVTAVEQGYSPPTIIEAAGVRQLILLRPDAVTSISPDGGQEYWSVPYEADAGSIIMSPVRWEDYLYVAGYNNKSLLLKLASDAPGAEVVWHNRGANAISPVNVQPFVEEGVLYGFDQKGMLRAIDLVQGERLWETSQPVGERPAYSGTAMLVRQGERCWLFTENGELVIARITREGYEELDRAKVIDATGAAMGRDVVWSMPAFANRHAYIRNDKECICVDLVAQQEGN